MPLPREIFSTDQVRQFDRLAIETHGISGEVLMERAGQAAYQLLRQRWPTVRRIVVVCGSGNNAGDGYVVARRARQEGCLAQVLSLGDLQRLQGDARRMADRYRETGGDILAFQGIVPEADLIVDAVLGIGLEREVTGRWAEAFQAMNHHPSPLLAIDIPSGLQADTGRILGEAVRATATITFIGLKPGLLTGEGPDCCGELFFDDLALPAVVYQNEPPVARRLLWDHQGRTFGWRRRTAHKGHFGHVLVVGGAPGLGGAARLAAEAAARVGAGLVSIATHPDHAPLLSLTRPELMSHGVPNGAALVPLLKRATAVAVGPGLGRGDWARELWPIVRDSGLPLVVDADALNLMAEEDFHPVPPGWVLTPHPGEAARLLGQTAAAVQADRLSALRQLQRHWGGVTVLKGAGTLVAAQGQMTIGLYPGANPGLASGGMGDVLTGLVAGLMAQGWSAREAAETAVCLHGEAANRASQPGGERGLLALDLFPELRRLVNPQAASVKPDRRH
ncbi:ADP-dependent (S)-NAD(P)H-hydrate dehydratase / NAD(P)H-hydrate epimerase [Gammaproteobacteria bacterium]